MAFREYRIKLTTAPASEPISLSDAKLHLRVTASSQDDLITDLIQAAREQVEYDTGLSLMQQTLTMYLDEFPEQAIELTRGPILRIRSVKYYDEDNVLQTLKYEDYYQFTVGSVYRPGDELFNILNLLVTNTHSESIQVISFDTVTCIVHLHGIESGEVAGDYTGTVAYTSGQFDYEYDIVSFPARIKMRDDNNWPDTYDRLNAVEIEYIAGYSSAANVPAKYRQAMLLLIYHWFQNPSQVVTGTIATELPFAYKALVADHVRGL